MISCFLMLFPSSNNAASLTHKNISVRMCMKYWSSPGNSDWSLPWLMPGVLEYYHIIHHPYTIQPQTLHLYQSGVISWTKNCRWCSIVITLVYTIYVVLVLTIFSEGTYLTFKSIYHKAINLFEFDCDITLESVPGTNQY